ncbi:hypothetical protein BDW02DRAFT_63089 [Decorospora gaudefroyi]|uniref:Heterokaryon incompatibility domain-containing protein n=1 Tax=Decorospora gaudefroyi TaxID=184978 RepID=A0A6A5K558_9PLEO|nr:hypothetical protein BDW02DRAFT_63089 [Decorospora gaudefroyi]
MFRWYEEASICYVYLSDAIHPHDQSFSHCRWFTRGWTLQELIAPNHVHFFDRTWTFLGSRISLSSTLSDITGIDENLMTRGHEDRKSCASEINSMSSYRCQYCAAIARDLRILLNTLSVAQRMKWASRRATTRLEDTAYCLMGLFDVNMPLLYGEGEKAFYRLQAEIIKESNDHSILAFRSLQSDYTGYSPMLASHPSFFQDDCRKEWMPNATSEIMSTSGDVLSIDLYICSLNPSRRRHIGIPDCMMSNDYLSRPALLWKLRTRA